MESSAMLQQHELIIKPSLQVSSSQQVFAMNSKYLLMGMDISERQTKYLKIYQWKLSQWGNQLKTQEIEQVDTTTLSQIKQIILSSFDDLTINREGIEESQDLNAFPQTRETTLAYILDQSNTLFEWSSEYKDKLTKLAFLGCNEHTKLLQIHPNNLFFAYANEQTIYIVQTFDKQIYAKIQHSCKVENLFFDMNNECVVVQDENKTLTQYDMNSSKLLKVYPLGVETISSLILSPISSQVIYFQQQSFKLNILSSDFESAVSIDLKDAVQRYTENNNQANLLINKIYGIKQIDHDIIALSTQSQVIIFSQYFKAVTKIIFLERSCAKSVFFTLKGCLYLAAHTQISGGDLNFYNIMEFPTSSSKADDVHLEEYKAQNILGNQEGIVDLQREDNDDDGEDEDDNDENVDIINEFAQQYENMGAQQQDIIFEEDEEESTASMQQSFRNTDLFHDISKQMETQSTMRQQQPSESTTTGGGLSVLDPFTPHAKSMFLLMNQKIEIDSIYDHTENYNKTRFSSNLPQKYTKTNLPVTFHKKIKSSGYGSQPNSLKFSTKQKQKVQQQQSGVQYFVTKNFFGKPLPMTIPDELAVLREKPLNKNATVKLCYSPLGTKLASICQDTTVSVIKTPMFQNQLDVTKLGGHNAQVNSIHFSANDQYLITASSDKTCIIWNLRWSKKGEKLLILDRLKKNKTSAENPLQNPLQQQQNPTLPDQIRRAQFYYEDKLLVLSTLNQLLFYQYELPDQGSGLQQDDVKRLQQKGLYKLIQTFTHPNAQHIPSFSFHNHRLKSQIGLIGGSNKELIIYDANYNKPISVVNDGHFKHIHTVKFYEGSYGDQEAYNTFLTASTDSFIKLWDLRVGMPVREFGNHQNRAMSIGFEISNCYRYLISGSEDRSVYIYDIGSGQLMDKTKNSQHGDSVTDVAVNPEYYEWATSCIDGHVRIFRYPAQKMIKKKPKTGGGGGGLVVKGKKVSVPQQQQVAESYDQY